MVLRLINCSCGTYRQIYIYICKEVYIYICKESAPHGRPPQVPVAMGYRVPNSGYIGAHRGYL